MSCEKVRPLIGSLVDRQLLRMEDGGIELRKQAMEHVAVCRACSAELEAAEWQRAAVRSLATAPIPGRLAARLQVIASHERARQLTRITWRARYEAASSRLSLQFENMMKPFALPIAGGLISALLMFGMLIPSVSFAHIKNGEPSSPIYTEPDGQVVGEGDRPKLESAYQASRGKIVVLLMIDDHGKVRDYQVKQGTMTPEVQNLILFSSFTPATILGQPTWGQVQVVFGDDGNDRRS